ncbi:hypothetical protein F3Y22_tig00005856pilonHSYRG00084 [Hibiscus syriacus]|uniref:C2H2-type domain-containing protein n=1 Tax=Hibiscus syriacus TaxID=106335 RepID=A0A6A3CDA5_HIBSY|nr:hypothetical protein F3Y22_tig00005856pilonHSYRG00084 [Hibiscus syriacus]
MLIQFDLFYLLAYTSIQEIETAHKKVNTHFSIESSLATWISFFYTFIFIELTQQAIGSSLVDVSSKISHPVSSKRSFFFIWILLFELRFVSMEKKSGKRKANEIMGFQGYGLRDNPKKSWKYLGSKVDDNATISSTLGFQCKACGKQFESTNALFGHTRHHSAKERKDVKCQECGRKF